MDDFIEVQPYDSKVWPIVEGYIRHGYLVVLMAYQSYGSYQYRYGDRRVVWRHVDHGSNRLYKTTFDTYAEERQHMWRTLGEAQGTVDLLRPDGSFVERLWHVQMIDRRHHRQVPEKQPYFFWTPRSYV